MPDPNSGPLAATRRSRSLLPASERLATTRSEPLGAAASTSAIRLSMAVACTSRCAGFGGDLVLRQVLGVTQRAHVDQGHPAPREQAGELLRVVRGIPGHCAGGVGRADPCAGSDCLDALLVGGELLAERAEGGVELEGVGGLDVAVPAGHDPALDRGDGRARVSGPAGAVLAGAGCCGPVAGRQAEPAVDRAGVGEDRAHRDRRGRPVAQERPEGGRAVGADVAPGQPAGADQDDRVGLLRQGGRAGGGRGGG